MLLACVAPRPLLVHSGVGDRWADPRGECLGLAHASPAFTLLGQPAAVSEERLLPNDDWPVKVFEGRNGYYLRQGGHYVSRADWRVYVNFAMKQNI